MNSKSPRRIEDDQRLAERAAEWLDLLESANEAERREFAEWLTSTPRNAEEMLLVTALAEQLKKADLRKFELVQATMNDAADNVVALGDANPRRPPPSPRRSPWLIGLAAGVALIALTAIWAMANQSPAYATTVGEQRTVSLSDGSTIDLNTQSRAKVRFSEAAREIRLEHGEAMFSVRKDVGRPFRVVTDDAVVQAIGTQFNVYRRPEGTTVSVVEGKVSLSPATGGEARVLSAGESAQIEGSRLVKALPKAATAKAVAWRQHRLVFLSSPLSEIAAEFNRYNRAPKLLVTDPHTGERTYSGVFDSGDPASLIQFLREDAELALERREGEIVIRAR